MKINENLSTKDKITPYLPHKSKVKADNQAIFVAGGIPRGLSTLSCLGVGYVS